jgi:hypothetical protein
MRIVDACTAGTSRPDLDAMYFSGPRSRPIAALTSSRQQERATNTANAICPSKQICSACRTVENARFDVRFQRRLKPITVVMPDRPDQSQVVHRAESLPGSLLQAAPTHLSVARVTPPRVSSQGR